MTDGIDTWVRICGFTSLPIGRGRRFSLDEDTEIAVFRLEQGVFAVSNICPHQHSALIADGWVENCAVSCPLHGYTFDLKSGCRVDGPGASIRTYAIRIDNGDVFVERPVPMPPRWMQQ